MCFSLNILSQFQKRTTLPNATSSLSCRCHRESTWTQQSTALQHQQLTFSKEPTRISQTPSIHLSTLNAPALESRSRFLKSCHVWFPSPIILEAALDSGAFVTQHRFERTSLHCDGTMRKIQKTSPKRTSILTEKVLMVFETEGQTVWSDLNAKSTEPQGITYNGCQLSRLASSPWALVLLAAWQAKRAADTALVSITAMIFVVEPKLSKKLNTLTCCI